MKNFDAIMTHLEDLNFTIGQRQDGHQISDYCNREKRPGYGSRDCSICDDFDAMREHITAIRTELAANSQEQSPDTSFPLDHADFEIDARAGYYGVHA